MHSQLVRQAIGGVSWWVNQQIVQVSIDFASSADSFRLSELSTLIKGFYSTVLYKNVLA